MASSKELQARISKAGHEAIDRAYGIGFRQGFAKAAPILFRRGVIFGAVLGSAATLAIGWWL